MARGVLPTLSAAGQKAIRAYWQNYYENTDALVRDPAAMSERASERCRARVASDALSVGTGLLSVPRVHGARILSSVARGLPQLHRCVVRAAANPCASPRRSTW